MTLLFLVALVVKPEKLLFYVYFVLFSTYLYAGLQKLNLNFVNTIWCLEFLQKTINLDFQSANQIKFKLIGFIFPVIEITLAILLLTKFRIYAIYSFILMHILVLGWLVYINYNEAVWVWNVMMIITLLILSFHQQFSLRKFLKDKVGKSYFMLLLVFPIFSFLNLYYPYFSASLYSGVKHYMLMGTENSNFQQFHSKFNKRLVAKEEDLIVFNPHNWAIHDLNVPLPPSKWVYVRLSEEISYLDSEAKFYIVNYPFSSYVEITC